MAIDMPVPDQELSMRGDGLRFFAVLCASILSSPLAASAPPPPPPYVFTASEILTDASNKDVARIDALFAPDMVADIDGQRIATGKAQWLSWWKSDRSHYFGKTIGYSMGWRGAGALLVLDEFDTQDTSIKSSMVVDPRLSTRSTLYRFGADGLIHAVAISEVDSFFIRAK